MKLSITCLECGYKQTIKRRIFDPCEVYIICISCETPIRTEVTDQIITSSKEEALLKKIFE